MRLVGAGRHLHEPDQQKQRDDDQPDQQIGTDQHRQIRIADPGEFRIGQRGAPGRIERGEPGLDELHCDIHAEQGADRIERLRKIQPLRRRLFAPHRQDIRIRAGFEK